MLSTASSRKIILIMLRFELTVTSSTIATAISAATLGAILVSAATTVSASLLATVLVTATATVIASLLAAVLVSTAATVSASLLAAVRIAATTSTISVYQRSTNELPRA